MQLEVFGVVRQDRSGSPVGGIGFRIAGPQPLLGTSTKLPNQRKDYGGGMMACA